MRNTTPLRERTCWCKCPVHLGQIGIEMEFILKRQVFRKDGCIREIIHKTRESVRTLYQRCHLGK